MNITGLGANRLRLKMRIMSDGDLLWLFLDHREECLQEFWEEVHTRKAAGTLSRNSPFWAIDELAPNRQICGREVPREIRGEGREEVLFELRWGGCGSTDLNWNTAER